MCTAVRDILRRHSLPREPRATGCQPVLRRLRGIKAVLFDIYGTLFVSGAHSIGSANCELAGTAFRDALASVGLGCRCAPEVGAQRLHATIRSMHEEARRRGREYPEVDILEVWRRTLTALSEDGVLVGGEIDAAQVRQLAVEFEWRTNPVWPMPHVLSCWNALRARGVRIGLISNAQFFTPELFPALFGATADELGVMPQWQFYSYVFGQAKPGTGLHRVARDTLRSWHIRAEETLCVGNDMRNDVLPAATVGFRTALFAGDQRSLRWTHCPTWAETAPDLVITDLAQLPPCVASTKHPTRSELAWYRAWWGMDAGKMQPLG